MKIHYKDGHIDFEAPIQMTDAQRERFIKFMMKMFPKKIKIWEKVEKRKDVGPIDRNPKKWDAKELAMLLSPKSNEWLADKMHRSEMSVRMERGHFVPEFMVWAKEKGYHLVPDEKIVQEFLAERGRR